MSSIPILGMKGWATKKWKWNPEDIIVHCKEAQFLLLKKNSSETFNYNSKSKHKLSSMRKRETEIKNKKCKEWKRNKVESNIRKNKYLRKWLPTFVTSTNKLNNSLLHMRLQTNLSSSYNLSFIHMQIINHQLFNSGIRKRSINDIRTL